MILLLKYRNPFLFGQLIDDYSHLSNNHGGWNKRGGFAKVVKSINLEVVEGGIFEKKVVHKCNKHELEGGKNLRNK